MRTFEDSSIAKITQNAVMLNALILNVVVTRNA